MFAKKNVTKPLENAKFSIIGSTAEMFRNDCHGNRVLDTNKSYTENNYPQTL